MLNGIFSIIKDYTIFFSLLNTVLGVILLVVGMYMLSRKKDKQSVSRKVGIVCTCISILMFLGAISNVLFTYITFV